MTASPPVAKPVRRRMVDVLRELRRPKVALMLALGFSSGLPFMLIGNTLGFWLAQEGIKHALIGFLSWIGLTYSLKFMFGAVVDRLGAPAVGFLGRRRGWMVITQIGVGAGLIAMSLCTPARHLGLLTVMGVVTGNFAAAQDTVIDAWRIETADDADELGLLTSSYSLGFRAALIATEAVILWVATAVGWAMAYRLYGGLMAVGLIASLLITEPVRADEVMQANANAAKTHLPLAVLDAVVGPLIAFFRAHGLALAVVTLLVITTYHLSDYMRGAMGNPFYVALGIGLPTIAAVRTTVGLAGTLMGVALGGLSSLRLGNRPTLILGAIIQPIAVMAFAILGWHGGDWALLQVGGFRVTAFAAIMTFDAFAIGYAGIGLMAYMSTLTSLGYTATQYALLTSAMTLSGKTLKGFSGAILDHLQQGRTLLGAYALFYLLCGAVGLPAIALCLTLARPAQRNQGVEP